MSIEVNYGREFPVKVNTTGKCIWLKQEGETVYYREEIGYLVIDEKNRIPLRSPVEGILKSILIQGDMIADAEEKDVPVALISCCLHEYVINNYCVNCHKVILDVSNYRQAISYDGFVEYLKDNVYQQQRIRNQTQMLQNRKLGLVFDLDNTLVEQTDDMNCKEAGKFGIPDVHIIQFTHNGYQLSNILIVRGGVRPMLKKLSSFFDLSVYTNGTRNYAEAVVAVLDPDHTLFGNRIIARNDIPENTHISTNNFDPASKDISVVLPGFDKMAIAVDDSIGVWKDQSCVIPVPAFQFWNAFSHALSFLEKNQITEDQQRRQEMYNRVNWYLSASDMQILCDSLLEIHKQFFSQIPSNATNTSLSPDFVSSVCAVSSVIMKIRSSLFTGRVVFVDTLRREASKSHLIRLIEKMGGRVEEEFSSQVTHYISSGAITQTLLDNCLNPAIRFVNEDWVHSCYSFAIGLSSKGYPVSGFDSICKNRKEKKETVLVEKEKVVEKEVVLDPELADVLEELDIMEKAMSQKREGEPVEAEPPSVKEVKTVSTEEQGKRRRNMFLGSF